MKHHAVSTTAELFVITHRAQQCLCVCWRAMYSNSLCPSVTLQYCLKNGWTYHTFYSIS